MRRSEVPLEDWLRKEIPRNHTTLALKGWRAVEAQHIVATLRIAGNNPDQQDLLERILEEHKPPLPADVTGLHYLLATPFRYPPASYGSRFRSWSDPGVLYAAIERRTACAEMGYWRWRFVLDSEGLREIPGCPQTVFRLGTRGIAIDLQHPPFSKRDQLWSDPVEYSSTQRLGRVARNQGIDMVVYRSVRDPEGGKCIAVLRPAALNPKRPLEQETWHLTVTGNGAIWQRERQRFQFTFSQ